MLVPSGVKATARTWYACPMTDCDPEAGIQRRTVRSSAANANLFPSGETSRQAITSGAPRLPASSFPVARSQMTTRPISPAASDLPSGRNATGPVARQARSTVGGLLVRFQSLTSWLHAEDDASVWPSAEKATDKTA